MFCCAPGHNREAASGSGKLLTGVGGGWEGPRPDLSQGRSLISS